MSAAIAHRGPDDEGYYLHEQVGLGNRRLSIIDLPGGRQPISNEDETIWIVYNGEIYNFQELRQWLENLGHSFRTRTDTEVIVHLYEELGEQCVERLRGMFAFALWDEKERKLVMARDRLGQKPLYYAHNGEELIFGSEIKAILAVSQGPPELNLEAMHHYLSLRFIPPPDTMLQHIQKLPPAHILVFRDAQLRISRYWDLSFREKSHKPEKELLEGLGSLLQETISAHLVSDVPVGAFLSGGMDSSMVVSIMAQDFQQTVNTFAVGVSEQDFDELPYARRVAEHNHTCHTETRVESDIIRSLPQMIWHLDEPSDPIAACQYFAARLASGHVKVVLGGDGGDELFGGFDRYQGMGYIDRYAKVPLLLRQFLLGPMLKWVPESFSYKSTSQKLRWLHQLSLASTPGMRYAEATSFFRFNHQEKSALYGAELWHKLQGFDSNEVIAAQYDGAPAAQPLDRMLYADINTRLPEHSLMLTDRMTMAHGLELRSPYLDHHIMEYLAALPVDLKIRGRQLKYALRHLASEYLPEDIVQREKHGFMFPVAYWFRRRLNPFLKTYLADSILVTSGMFRHQQVMNLVDEHRNSRRDHHVRLWMLLNLAIWQRLYIDREPLDDVQLHLEDHLNRVTGPVPAD